MHVVDRRIRAALAVAAALAIALVARRSPSPRIDQASLVDTMALGDTIMIAGMTPTCAACSFDVGHVATIGSRTDAEIPQRVPDVLRDSRGNHYLVFHGWVNKPILRYDSAGNYLGKLGRFGQGPGEYSMTMAAFIGPGDSLYVWANGRLQLFDADGSYVRGARAALRATPIGLGPAGDETIYSWRRGRPATGHGSPNPRPESLPFVLVSDSVGTVRDSFPIFTAGFITEAEPAVGADGAVWTSLLTGDSYRLERHAPDGRVEKLFGVMTSAGGVPPIMTRAQADSIRAAAMTAARGRGRPPNGSPTRPPPRSRMHMLVDSAGLLWIARTIPAPRWDTLTITPERGSPDEAPEERTIPREQEDRMHHTVIEVIDPRRAQLIARTQVPFLAQLARPGFVARVTADEDGAYRTEVHRVTLQRR